MELINDPKFIKAAEVISKAEQSGRKLGFYEPE